MNDGNSGFGGRGRIETNSLAPKMSIIPPLTLLVEGSSTSPNSRVGVGVYGGVHQKLLLAPNYLTVPNRVILIVSRVTGTYGWRLRPGLSLAPEFTAKLWARSVILGPPLGHSSERPRLWAPMVGAGA